MSNRINTFPSLNNVQELREEARQLYSSSAWPMQRDEEWRRSDPQAIPFDLLEKYDSDKAMRADTEAMQRGIEQSIENHPEFEAFSYLPLDALQNKAAMAVLSRTLHQYRDRVDLWRMLHFTAGAVIIVPDEKKIHAPIEFSFFGNDSDKIYAPILITLIGRNSSVKLSAEIFGDGFFLPVTLTAVDEGAKYNAVEFQRSSLDSIVISDNYLYCRKNAELQHTSIQLGAMLATSRNAVHIDGTQANIIMNGTYFANQDQLLDLRTYQRHYAENSYSRVRYNGVAVDEAHTVFRGLIDVAQEAKETDAYLTNRNLLLSEDARMDSIPCLNINTNEVRCSHGSTTGDLDENHLFYLQSRGMTTAEARNLLIESFMESLLDTEFSNLNKKITEELAGKL